MALFLHDDLEFHYLDRGGGVPVVFQHGLGGDVAKIFALVQLPMSFRLIGMDCRGHGTTIPLGPLEKLRFECLADDLIALLNDLKIDRAVFGGTSMGAGVALNCALRYPGRVLGLVLLRPAWLDSPNDANAQLFGTVAQLLRSHGPEQGKQLFAQTALFESVARESSDTAESLLGLFSDPRAMETVARMERVPQDAPNRDRGEWQRISTPTLVLATEGDPVHPFTFAEIIAHQIRGAELRTLTPKSVSLVRYTSDLNRSLAEFLESHFLC